MRLFNRRQIWLTMMGCILTILTLLTTWQTATAETIDSPTKGQSYTIGLDDTFAPMGFRDEQGNLVGFDIDLAQAIAELYQWQLKFQTIDWAMKETELNAGKIDMIWNGYGINAERKEKVLLTESYLDDASVIITKKGSGITQLSDLKGKRVATQSGSTTLDNMKSWPDNLYNELAGEPVLYSDFNQAFIDLASGRIDAVYVGGVYGLYTLSKRADRADYEYFKDPISASEGIGVGIRKSNPEIKEAIDRGIEQLRKDGRYDAIYNKWFGTGPAEGGANPANSGNPQATVGKTLTIGLDDTFAPMGYRNEAGELVGFDIDLAQAIAKLYQWNLKFQTIDWAMKETELNAGNIDMIWNGYGITPERLEKVTMSDPYIESAQLIVSKKDSGIDQLADLKGKKLATQAGSTSLDFMNNWPPEVLKGLNGEPVLYQDYNQAFTDLASGRVDVVYVGSLYGLYILNQRPDGADYQHIIDPTSTEPMGVGVAKGNQDLQAALNVGFKQLHDNGEYEALYTKWFGEPDVPAKPKRPNVWQQMRVILPSLLDGLKLTLLVFVIVLAVSIPLGFIVGVLRVFGPKWVQWLIEGYVFIMRGSPLMLQLMVFFFGLPYIGITLDRLPAALMAFIINYAAYFAEIFRGGISSVPAGQFESIEVLGIGRLRGFVRIILPQVFRIVMPSVGNEVIALVKDSSLIYVIGLGEMLRASSIAANREASLLPYLLAGGIYLILTAIFTYFLRRVETKLEW